MISNNLRVLRAYILSIAISLFVSLAIGALYKYLYITPTIVTSLITVCLLYCQVWKIGQKDNEQNTVSFLKAFLNTVFFIGVATLFEVIVAICTLLHADAMLGVFTRAGIVWFYPFVGFYHEPTFLMLTPIVTLIIVLLCIISYYMGANNISIIKIIKNRLK